MKCQKIIIDINDSKKEFTLLGETHSYTKKESKWAQEFINNNKIDLLMYEGAEGQNLGKIGRIAFYFISPLQYILMLLLGRTHPSINQWCKKKNIRKIFLEKGTELPILSQLLLLGYGLLAWYVLITAAIKNPYDLIPIAIELRIICYLAEKINIISKIYDKISEPMANVNNRNHIMSEKALSIIKTEHEQNILMVVGIGHFDEIMAELSKHLQIISIRNLDPPI